jgi:hypothetical protein
MITAIDTAVITTVAAAAARAAVAAAMVAVAAAAVAESSSTASVAMAVATVAAEALAVAVATAVEETYQKDATEEANLDVGAETDSDGVPTLDSKLAAMLDSDRVEAINSDGAAVLDSNVMVVIALDMMVAIDSDREEADKSEGLTGAVSAGLVVTGDDPARCGSSSRGCSGRDRLRWARASSDQLGSDGGDGLNYGDDEGLKVGRRGRRFGVEGRKSKSDRWTNGHEVEASAECRPRQSSRITFDKDNPVGFVLSGAAAKDSEL